MAESDGKIELVATIDTRQYDSGAAKIDAANTKLESSTRRAAAAVNSVSDAGNRGGDGVKKLGGVMQQAGTNVEGFGSKTTKASSLSVAAMGAIGGIASSMASTVMGAISGLTGDIIEASDSAQKFSSTLQFAGLDDSKIQQLTASTQKYADQTVYSISDIRNITSQLAANGVQGYDQLAEAAGNLNAVAGGTSDTFSSVGMVLTQTAGAGKLTTENWNQLADAIPGASGQLQEAMLKNGAYTGNFRDAMAEGQITAEEFNKAIMGLGMTDAAKEAATSTKTIKGALGNLQASAVGVGTSILDAIKPALTGGMNFLSTLLGNLSSGITTIIPSIVSGLSGIGDAFMSAFGPATQSLDGFISGIKAQFSNIGTTLMPALQNIGTNIGTTFGNLFAGVMPIIQASIQHVTGMFTTFAPAITTVVSSISNVVAALSPVFQTVGSTIGQVMSTMSGIMTSVASSVLPVVMSLVQNIATIITSNAPMIQQIFSQVQTSIQSLLPIFQQIVTVIVNTLSPAIQPLAAAITNLISSVLPVLLNIINQLLPIITQVAQTVLSAVVPVVQNISTVIQGIIDVLTGVITFVTGVFTGNWSQAWEGVKQIFSGLWTALSGIVQGAISAITGIISGLGAILSGIFNSIKTVVVNVFTSMWNGAKSAVQNGISGVMSFFSGLQSQIMSALSGAGSWLLSTGKDIIRGMIDGIKSMVSNMISTITNAAKNAVDAAKKFLHIGSPSRTFRDEVGQWIPAGISVGITSNMDEVQQALNRGLNMAVDHTNIPTIPPLTTERVSPLPVQSTQPAASQTGNTIVFNQTTNYPQREPSSMTRARALNLAAQLGYVPSFGTEVEA